MVAKPPRSRVPGGAKGDAGPRRGRERPRWTLLTLRRAPSESGQRAHASGRRGRRGLPCRSRRRQALDVLLQADLGGRCQKSYGHMVLLLTLICCALRHIASLIDAGESKPCVKSHRSGEAVDIEGRRPGLISTKPGFDRPHIIRMFSVQAANPCHYWSPPPSRRVVTGAKISPNCPVLGLSAGVRSPAHPGHRPGAPQSVFPGRSLLWTARECRVNPRGSERLRGFGRLLRSIYHQRR
jgi:hypothetical protein